MKIRESECVYLSRSPLHGSIIKPYLTFRFVALLYEPGIKGRMLRQLKPTGCFNDEKSLNKYRKQNLKLVTINVS